MPKTATELHVWREEADACRCRLCEIQRTDTNDKQECPVGRDRLERRCLQAYSKLISPLRAVAVSLGYALAVHGSLARDIDLIACPWAELAVDARELAEAIRAEAERVLGYASMHAHEMGDEYFECGSPCAKPWGRLVWSYHLGGGPYIDLSVMAKFDHSWELIKK
jgi:hypothetical protein